jgi:hypothetical protein
VVSTITEAIGTVPFGEKIVPFNIPEWPLAGFSPGPVFLHAAKTKSSRQMLISSFAFFILVHLF